MLLLVLLHHLPGHLLHHHVLLLLVAVVALDGDHTLHHDLARLLAVLLVLLGRHEEWCPGLRGLLLLDDLADTALSHLTQVGALWRLDEALLLQLHGCLLTARGRHNLGGQSLLLLRLLLWAEKLCGCTDLLCHALLLQLGCRLGCILDGLALLSWLLLLLLGGAGLLLLSLLLLGGTLCAHPLAHGQLLDTNLWYLLLLLLGLAGRLLASGWLQSVLDLHGREIMQLRVGKSGNNKHISKWEAIGIGW